MKAKVNGFRFQSALRDLELKKQTSQTEFNDSLFVFSTDNKSHPEIAMKSYWDAEQKLAQLQELQTRYNLDVVVPLRMGSKDVRTSLQHAIKLVGGASRQEKLWREAASGKKSKYDYRSEDKTVRNKDSEYAQAVMTSTQTAERIREASKFVSALREAIQIGNATSLEMDVPDWFSSVS